MIIAGTGVLPAVARQVYRSLAEATGASRVVSLHQAGLGHTAVAAERAMREILGGPAWSSRPGRVELIGHSQGGLVAALIAAAHPEKVARVVTLGAPLGGTLLCLPAIPVAGIRCMTRHSRVCTRLCGSARMLNVAGTKDALVLPFGSAFLPGAHHRHFPVGHLGLIRDSRVLEFVGAWLEDPAGAGDLPAA